MIQQIKIKEIDFPAWSFKNVDSDHYKSLEASIHKNGQTKNIIVRRLKSGRYEIIDGRQVFSIIKTTNVDYIYCYVYQGKGLLSAMLLYLQHDYNFQNNFVEIALALKKLNKQYPILELSKYTRYNYTEIQELINLANYDFSKFEIQESTKQEQFF